jgi:hypothetical protein
MFTDLESAEELGRRLAGQWGVEFEVTYVV